MRGELGDLVAEALELDAARMSRNEARPSMSIGDSPCADFTPRLSRPLEAARTRDHTPIPIFSSGERGRLLWRLHELLKSCYRSVARCRRARTETSVKYEKLDTPRDRVRITRAPSPC